MLSTRAARAIRVDAEVRLVDLDRHVVGEQRRDDDLSEGRMATMRRVERREPDEPVHATFRLERPVRVLSLDGHRRRLETRLLPRARLEHLRLEATVGGPAEVHAQQHVGPVLCVRPARPGVDLEDRVARVVLAVEERVLTHPLELPLE